MATEIKLTQGKLTLIDSDGYCFVFLSKKSKIKCLRLHRLLYSTFVSEIPDNLQINHKDGDKTNNALSNLELVTNLENVQHSWRIGLRRKYFGEENSFSKLNDNIVREIFKLHALGSSIGKIARTFKVSWATVYYVLKRKTWKHVKIPT